MFIIVNLPTVNLAKMKNGDMVAVAGLVTVRQRQGTTNDVIFVTIEDETGFANPVVLVKVSETCRRDIVQARLLWFSGKCKLRVKSST